MQRGPLRLFRQVAASEALLPLFNAVRKHYDDLALRLFAQVE